MHKEISLNQGWVFHKGDIDVPFPASKGAVYSQSKTERKLIGPAAYHYLDTPDCYGAETELRSEGWKYVNLPHDYIIDQTPIEDATDATGYFHYDNAWYRKHFSVDPQFRGKRITLLFEGIRGAATIYLNGCLMKHNFSGYNSFEVNISDNVYFDRENILAVYVKGTEFEGWWYQGAGIYRDVTLLITDPVAIDLYGVYAPAKKITDSLWFVDFRTTVLNCTDQPASVLVESCLLDAAGVEITRSQTSGSVDLRDQQTFAYRVEVSNPALWDTDHPYLYTVRTTVTSGNHSDENTTRIGFRTVEVSPETGLLINGKKTILKGVCCHQDFGLTGIAVPSNVAKYKIQLIKEMGANAFRTSHYQNSTATMDALDELGFLVMDETRWFESTDEGLGQLRTLVKRDRNRPSVIFWSTGNEEPYHITDVGYRIHKTMAAEIRKLDSTRLVMSAESNDPLQSKIFDDCDVIGINYGLECYDAVHQRYPEKAVFASECCATGTTRGWYLDSNTDGRIRDMDRDTNSWFRGRELTWKFLMERDYVLGGFQWDAVEHRGEAVWPALCSKSGAIDLFLQKKGAFYQNQSHWTDAPMVHIVPHWNFKGMEGQQIVVPVYTNCDSLELFLNGTSLGKQEIEKYGHGEWDVTYAPGELKVIGYRDGKQVAEHTRKTTKAPARLVLRQDLAFRPNNYDIGLFTCECVDEDGLVVEDATPFVSFSVNEGAEIVGTGSDNCDHHKVTLPQRRMYAGKITVGVRVCQEIPNLRLYAQSENLGMTMLEVSFDSQNAE